MRTERGVIAVDLILLVTAFSGPTMGILRITAQTTSGSSTSPTEFLVSFGFFAPTAAATAYFLRREEERRRQHSAEIARKDGVIAELHDRITRLTEDAAAARAELDQYRRDHP